MRKRWILTIAAAVSLALCIGLNTAIFSVFNATLLRPLPFPEPERIVEIYNTYPKQGLDRASSNPALYTVYNEGVEAINGFTLTDKRTFIYGAADGAERLWGMQATPDFFSTLKMSVILGEPFQSQHAVLGNHHVVLLSYDLWQNSFGAREDVVGEEILLDGRSFTILGVLPEKFRRYDPGPKLIVPLVWNPAQLNLNQRHWNSFTLLGRLADGATVEHAQAQVDAIDAAYRDTTPEIAGFLDRSGHQSVVNTFQDERASAYRGTVYLLQAFVLAILVIGGLNIANLRMAEVAGRERELGLRRVLGGSRRALLWQLLTEASLIGILGGALGLFTAWLSLGMIRNSFAGMFSDTESITLDGPVLLWSLALIVMTILIIGLYPARLLWRLNFQVLLQEGGRSATGGRGALRSSLGAVQTMLAVLLLIAAGLFVRSFWNATSVSPGFETEKITTFRIAMPKVFYPNFQARNELVQRVLTDLRELPGVESVAGSSTIPVRTPSSHNALTVRGDVLANEQVQKGADNIRVTDDFFKTLGIPIMDGREFEVTDTLNKRLVYVVDERFGKQYLPDGAVGGNFRFGSAPESDDDWPIVVGQASPIVLRDLTNLSPAPMAYWSYYQSPSAILSFFLRSERPHDSLMADVRQVMRQIDPQIPIYLDSRLGDMVDESLMERRGILGLTILFGIVALLLAVAGICGVQIYNLQANRKTMAIRAAIGATPLQILMRTFLRGLIPVALGLVGGLVIALALAPKLNDLLFSVNPRDPMTLSSVLLFVLLVSAVALFIPARTASRANPGPILHEE